MKALLPISLAFDDLTLCSVPETDAPSWNAASSYSVGDRVLRLTTHRIYERVLAGTSAGLPEADNVNWLDVGPSNRWAPFDANPGTVCLFPPSQTPARWAFLLPDDVRDVVLLHVRGSAIQLRINGALTRDVSLDSGQVTPAVIITGIWAPVGATLDLQIIGSTNSTEVENSELGWCGLGELLDLGRTLPGATLSLTDYSTKTTDDFGVVSVTRRPYARRLQAQAVVPTDDVDTLSAALAALRATVTWWQVDDSVTPLECYSTLGFVKDWSVDVPDPIRTSYSVTIEGIAQADVVISPGEPLTLTGAEALVASGNYDLKIESSLGTEFRYGQNTQTLLTARVFRNGEEVTADLPESWFRWRRTSRYPQQPPNDDDTWNAAYRSGYKAISISVDDVLCRAVFFCTLIKP